VFASYPTPATFSRAAIFPSSPEMCARRRFTKYGRTRRFSRTLRDFSKLAGKCGVCEYRGVCGGCRARAFYETGSYLDEEPYCTYLPRKSKE
jgi:radical SAM protein with 4Fe4S-binding SPASM domain